MENILNPETSLFSGKGSCEIWVEKEGVKKMEFVAGAGTGLGAQAL